jgi:predicted AlkP superfamily phosphohydrolase/phosphomutase
MAEDTKALSQGIFDDEDFVSQGRLIQQEREDAFRYELDRYEDGLLFAYFSASDLPVHMFYRAIDPKNPLWTPELADEYGDAIKNIYGRLDRVLGEGMKKFGDDALIMVMSDHGFSPYRRSFDVNRWLQNEGYLSVDDGDGPALNRAEWSRSKAYGMGFNGLYVNEVGREIEGSVSPGPAKDKLVDELQAKLAEARDRQTGEKVFHAVRRTSDYFDRPPKEVAPDLILGYARGYRGSWESAIGEMAENVSSDNLDKWSGDHCMDQEAVAGSLICNHEIESDTPALIDLAPSILRYFDITPPMEMRGEPVLRRA